MPGNRLKPPRAPPRPPATAHQHYPRGYHRPSRPPGTTPKRTPAQTPDGRVTDSKPACKSRELAMGIVWCAVDLRWSTEPVLVGIGFSLFYLGPVAVFTHLVLALPTGRLATWPERLVALGVYLNVLVTQPMRYFVEHPRPP